MFFRAKCTLILLVLLAGRAGAQVFRVQGGTSTLLNAEGGSVDFKAPNYDGSVGLGYYNGKVQFGAETRYLFHGYTVLGGDDSVPFTLPTDVFDASHYFSARGIGVERADAQRTFYAFAGTTSTWLGTGFFNAATSDKPVAVFFYERKLSKNVKFVSRDIISNRQTFLESLEWKPQKWVRSSLSEGIGSNQKYFAAATDV